MDTKNWKTTILGAVATLPTLLQVIGVAIPEPISKLILAVGSVMAFYFAKDKDQSGNF